MFIVYAWAPRSRFFVWLCCCSCNGMAWCLCWCSFPTSNANDKKFFFSLKNRKVRPVTMASWWRIFFLFYERDIPVLLEPVELSLLPSYTTMTRNGFAECTNGILYHGLMACWRESSYRYRYRYSDISRFYRIKRTISLQLPSLYDMPKYHVDAIR